MVRALILFQRPHRIAEPIPRGIGVFAHGEHRERVRRGARALHALGILRPGLIDGNEVSPAFRAHIGPFPDHGADPIRVRGQAVSGSGCSLCVSSSSLRTGTDPQSIRSRSPSACECAAPHNNTRSPVGSMNVTPVRSRTSDDAPLSKACRRESSSAGALAMSSSPAARTTSESPCWSIRIVNPPCVRTEIEVAIPANLPSPQSRQGTCRRGGRGRVWIAAEGEGHEDRAVCALFGPPAGLPLRWHLLRCAIGLRLHGAGDEPGRTALEGLSGQPEAEVVERRGQVRIVGRNRFPDPAPAITSSGPGGDVTAWRYSRSKPWSRAWRRPRGTARHLRSWPPYR